MVLKLNHPVTFDIFWFAEFNPQIDWHKHFVSLDLDAELHTIISTRTSELFSDIDLCNAD